MSDRVDVLYREWTMLGRAEKIVNARKLGIFTRSCSPGQAIIVNHWSSPHPFFYMCCR
jgi:hypothetical protein